MYDDEDDEGPLYWAIAAALVAFVVMAISTLYYVVWVLLPVALLCFIIQVLF